ncbi:MAG: T9SS type A sorting domain-containing protein, partial [Chitinophagaceae bacterium]
YGCTEVMLDRAGTGTSAFWNNNTANFLMHKTFQVSPTANNTSGQYEITLYYTDAEKLGYEAATGQSWNTVQLIKVPSQISNYTAATPNPDGGGVQTVSPTIGTMGSYHTLTHTFSTGFSGFGVGRPGVVLPVTLLDFRGKPEAETVVLDWSTSSEYEAKQFEVQKSSDGVLFYTRGLVNAAGNSSVHQVYSFTDKQLSENNYYRLKISDRDGRSSFSQVVLIRNSGITQKVWVVNNPFQDFIDLKFAKSNGGKTGVELIDAAGNLVYRRNYRSTGESLKVDLSSLSLPPGVYVLKVEAGNTRFTSKVFKK